MKDQKSCTIDDTMSVRCITDCHVTGEVIIDRDHNQKRMTLRCDNADNNEFVVLFKTKNLNSVPYSNPADIIYHSVPNTAVVNDEVVFQTNPLQNTSNNPQYPLYTMDSTNMKVNNLVDGFHNARFTPFYNDTGADKTTKEIVNPPYIEMEFKLEGDSFIITRAAHSKIESTTVKMYINDIYVTTTRSYIDCFDNTPNNSAFGIKVRVCDPATIAKLKEAFKGEIVIKLLQTTEPPSIDNFRIPVFDSRRVFTIKYNGATYVCNYTGYDPVWVGWGVREFNTDIEITIESSSGEPLVEGDLYAFLLMYESAPASMNDGAINSKYGIYMLPEPGSTNHKATVKIKKEWIPVLSKIVAGYNFEKIQDQAKLLSVVPNVFV